MFRSPFLITLSDFWTLLPCDLICADLCYSADKPQEDPNIRGDAFKTLIAARLHYDCTEQDLESEFGRFGPIERVRLQISFIECITKLYLDQNCG